MMKYLLLAAVISLGACIPELEELDEIRVTFGGRITDGSSGDSISGVRVTVPQLDSLRTAGYAPSVTGDTSQTGGFFQLDVKLDEPRKACRNNVPLIITLRFTDTHDRYQAKDKAENLCRYTVQSLNEAASIQIGLTRKP
jgi:hypothetical protein